MGGHFGHGVLDVWTVPCAKTCQSSGLFSSVTAAQAGGAHPCRALPQCACIPGLASCSQSARRISKVIEVSVERDRDRLLRVGSQART